MEGLSFDNILGEQEIENLFMNDEETTAEETAAKPSTEEETDVTGKEKNDETETTEVDPEGLFEEEVKEKPESVGSEKKDKEEKGDSSTDDGGGASPENFYSSIASAMAEDGIFPNLDEETIKKADSAEGLSDLIEAEVNARLDEKQQRIAKALENGVEPDNIRMYEGTLQKLSSIKDTDITAESENGEQLRYQLIVQDYLNKGISRERADKMARRSIDAGTDVEDAKDALQSNKEFFQNAYNKLLKDAEKEAEADKAERQKQSDKLKDSILKDKTLMGDMEISGDLRKKVLENISRPVYKDPETGEYLTSIQKYEAENRADFLKYVGLFYTLTNGFKDFESFTKGKVQKEVKKGLSQLEKTLNSTRRNQDGSLKMVTSVQEDPNSFVSKGWKLDI